MLKLKDFRFSLWQAVLSCGFLNMSGHSGKVFEENPAFKG